MREPYASWRIAMTTVARQLRFSFRSDSCTNLTKSARELSKRYPASLILNFLATHTLPAGFGSRDAPSDAAVFWPGRPKVDRSCDFQLRNLLWSVRFNSRPKDGGTMNKKLGSLAFGILVVLANLDLTPHGTGTRRKPFQPWVKRGRIIAPGFAGPQSQSRVSAPSVVRLKNGRLRMYFWATGRGHHYIYAAEASPKNPYEWKLVKEEPVLGPSPDGNINDKGPSFPWVIQQHDRWLMYYVAWGSWAPPDEISNRTGLAISDDEGIHWKVLKEPLLPLGKPGEYDAGVTGSVAVLKTGPQTYQMWYTAGERYADPRLD